jgi:hypothetical protein
MLRRRTMEMWSRVALGLATALVSAHAGAQAKAGSLEISVAGRVQFYSPELLLPRTILTPNFPTGTVLVEGLPVFPGQPAPTSGYSDGATLRIGYAVRNGLQLVVFSNMQGQPAVQSTERGLGLRFETPLDSTSGLSYQVGVAGWTYTLAPYTGVPRKTGARSGFYGGGEESRTGVYGGLGWWQTLGPLVVRLDALVQSVGGGDDRRRRPSIGQPTGFAATTRDLNYGVELGVGYRLFR